VGPDGLVARLGGDEFAVLAPESSSATEPLEELAARLLVCVEEPFTVDEVQLEVGASIGISRFPVDGTDSHSLLRRADVAMYQAKEARTGWKLYEASRDHHSVRKLSVLSEIRHAIASDQIVLHYQPIVDLGE
jgi:diguanylate cyclase